MSDSPASTLHLVKKADLAAALDVSPRAVSMAVQERQPCRGYPLHDWIQYGSEGQVRGFDVPLLARLQLQLPPFAEAASTDPDAIADQIVKLLTARVLADLTQELKPWLTQIARQHAGSGAKGDANSSDSDEGTSPDQARTTDTLDILEAARKSLENLKDEDDT